MNGTTDPTINPPSGASEAMSLLSSPGARLIATERRRQVEQEGWTPQHDAEHDVDVLARAAACYALPQRIRETSLSSRPEGYVPSAWPWAHRWWKPTPDDRIRELVKAGALIAAEIDRLQVGGAS